MVASFAFANKGRMSVQGTSTYPAVVDFGVVKDVELVVGSEHVPLYGWGSILRQNVAKHTAKVSVKVGYMKIDPAATTTAAWQFFILNPSTATANTSGLLEDGSNEGNTVKLFTIVSDFVFESGVTLRGTVSNVYFPNFPMKAAEGQWVKVDMTGEGQTVAFTNP
jgi:hypothetical protein